MITIFNCIPKIIYCDRIFYLIIIEWIPSRTIEIIIVIFLIIFF